MSWAEKAEVTAMNTIRRVATAPPDPRRATAAYGRVSPALMDASSIAAGYVGKYSVCWSARAARPMVVAQSHCKMSTKAYEEILQETYRNGKPRKTTDDVSGKSMDWGSSNSLIVVCHELASAHEKLLWKNLQPLSIKTVPKFPMMLITKKIAPSLLLIVR